MKRITYEFSELKEIILECYYAVKYVKNASALIKILPDIFIEFVSIDADKNDLAFPPGVNMIISFPGNMDHKFAGYINKISPINLSIIFLKNVGKISRKADLIIESYLNSNIEKSLYAEIMPKIDISKIKHYCNLPMKEFNELGKTVNTPYGKYIYIDRGGDVLAVAHLDTVQNGKKFSTSTDDFTGEPLIHSASLDDRLGVYAILELLPSIGINCDVLLTEGEETGNSTAQFFKTGKKYNWMFQFDRSGIGAVLYQYESEKLNKMLETCDFRIEEGSFSDIVFLERLGIKGINFGTGYYDNHSLSSYANLAHFAYSINRFVKFYNKYKDQKLAHEPISYNKRFDWDIIGERDDHVLLNCDCCEGKIFDDEKLYYIAELIVCSDCNQWLMLKGMGYT